MSIRRGIRLFYPLFVWLSLAAPALGDSQPGIDSQRCREAVLQIAGLNPKEFSYAKLDTEQRAFLENVWLPTLGMRALYKDPQTPRSCKLKGKNCVVLGNFGEQMDVEIRWERRGTEPRIEVQPNGMKVLVIPRGYDWAKSSDGGADIVREFLVGHEIQPYNADKQAAQHRTDYFDEPAILEKQVQIEGKKAVIEAIERGDSSFLFIGPTSMGKTEVLLTALEKRIQQSAQQIEREKLGRTLPGESGARKVHVLLLPDRGLKFQSLQDVEKLKEKMGVPFEIVSWGDGEGHQKVSALAAQAQDSDVPIVVVTTTHSLLLSLETEITGDHATDKAAKDKVYGLLRSNLATLLLDEAHHAGADNLWPVLKELLDRRKGSRAFHFGTTATPAHANLDLIEAVYASRAFWAYLDTADSYRTGDAPINRRLPEIVEQLSAAIRKGEASGFSVVPLDPQAFEDNTGTPLFQSNKDSRDLIDPLHHDNVAQLILPYFLSHKRGFVTAGGTDEAVIMAGKLQAILDDYVLNPQPGKPVPRFLEEMSAEQRAELAEDIRQTKAEGTRKRRRATVAFLHSDMSESEKKQVKEDFQNGIIQFLFTVRMLDEGKNIPDLTLWIDLNSVTNPKQQLQRLGRILRLAVGKGWLRRNGKHEVEWVSFQDPRDIEMVQMLLDLYAISEGRSLESSRRLPRHKSSNTSSVDPDGELVRSIMWSEKALRDLATQFFYQDSETGEKTGALEARQIIDRIDAGGVLNAFATDTKDVRSAYDKLTSRLDMPNTRAGKRKFDVIIQSHPVARELVDRITKQRIHTRKLLKTGAGAAAVVIDFVDKYNRVPEKVTKIVGVEKPIERCRDEKEIAEAVERHKSQGDIDFLLATSAKLRPTHLRILGVSQRIDKILKDPSALLNAVDDFILSHDGQLPDEDGDGFEKDLALALKTVVLPIYPDSRPVAQALRAVREWKENQKARRWTRASKSAAAFVSPVEVEVLTAILADIPQRRGALDSYDHYNRSRLDALERQLKKYRVELQEYLLVSPETDKELWNLCLNEVSQTAAELFSFSGLLNLLDGPKFESHSDQIQLRLDGAEPAVLKMERFYRDVIENLGEGWEMQTKVVKNPRNNQRTVTLKISSPQMSDLTAWALFNREANADHLVTFTQGQGSKTQAVAISILNAPESVAAAEFQRSYAFDSDQLVLDSRIGDRNRFAATDFVNSVRAGLLSELRARFPAAK